MARIDESRLFVPVNIAVLTVSDTRTESDDTSGNALAERIAKAGHRVAARAIEKDDAAGIERRLRSWIADPQIDAVITTGGTGITGRDVTPEAFERVVEKRIEGFGELFRMLSYQKIGTSTIQSRALGGVAGGTYLFALPGSSECGEGSLGRYTAVATRQPAPALQPRRADASVAGAHQSGDHFRSSPRRRGHIRSFPRTRGHVRSSSRTRGSRSRISTRPHRRPRSCAARKRSASAL